MEHKVAGKWKHFGVFLGVDEYTIEVIANDYKGGASHCMLQLVSMWMTEQSGTGTLPRTWETVVKAVKDTGFGAFAEELAKKYGIGLS